MLCSHSAVVPTCFMMNCLQSQPFILKIPSALNTPASAAAHSSLLTQNRNSAQKTASFVRTPTAHLWNSSENHIPVVKAAAFIKTPCTHLLNSLQNGVFALKSAPSLRNFLKTSFPLSFLAVSFTALPSLAAETELAAEIDLASSKINLESIVIAIDDFNNRNPFFVAGITFIWLVVIPLTQENLKKFKFISAIDAFRKLRDIPSSQLLDIRKNQSLKYLSTPNLKILNKNAVHVELSWGEDVFVKEVLKNFPDPGNTVLCILDNFGDSLPVAELLFKNGFKEVYAIRGGLRGKDGWQAIQEDLLPPSMHVYPRKKKGENLGQADVSRMEVSKDNSSNGQPLASASVQQERN